MADDAVFGLMLEPTSFDDAGNVAAENRGIGGDDDAVLLNGYVGRVDGYGFGFDDEFVC